VSSPEFQAWLRYKNATGSDIYIGMNPLRKHASTRTKEDIKAIRHVYLDLDHGGQEALNSVENSRALPKPNYILTSSPGKFQIVWKVEGMGLREAEALLHAMARECGGDPAATDATRVLRLPGFANKKYETNFFVEVRRESAQIYRLRDFKLDIDSQDPPRYNDHEGTKRAGSSRANLSQSEYDWAFANRALARGEPLEEVIRRIAQYRAAFKSNPLYYARHTVMKVAKLFRQNSSTENKKDGRRDSKEELPSEH
jgi:RepB DNA-primase N-terminal domain